MFSGCESEILDWKCQETLDVVILLTIAESQYLVDHHAAASVGVFFFVLFCFQLVGITLDQS